MSRTSIVRRFCVPGLCPRGLPLTLFLNAVRGRRATSLLFEEGATPKDSPGRTTALAINREETPEASILVSRRASAVLASAIGKPQNVFGGSVYCPYCGTPNDDNNFKCVKCAKVIQGTPVVVSDPGDSAAMRMLLPVGRSGFAIAAGYAGLFALLIFPAPLALVLGLLAVRDIRKNPKKHGMGRAVFGLVTGVLGTAFLLWLGLLMLREA